MPQQCAGKGGKGSITEQLLNARPDVTLGGGAKTFAETATAGEWQGKTLREQAQARGYQIVTDAASLAAATEASQDKPLLGLFADGNMPVRWEGPKASYHGNIDKPPVTCTPNPKRDASVPTLAQMTEKAIDLLSRNEKVSSCKSKALPSISRTMRPIRAARSAKRLILTKRCRRRWNSREKTVIPW